MHVSHPASARHCLDSIPRDRGVDLTVKTIWIDQLSPISRGDMSR